MVVNLAGRRIRMSPIELILFGRLQSADREATGCGIVSESCDGPYTLEDDSFGAYMGSFKFCVEGRD